VQTRAQQLLRWRPCQSKVGRKVGGCYAAFRGGGAESPSNTLSPGPRPTSVPSGILIHPAVSPQYTNVTDSTDRQDRQAGWFLRPIAFPVPNVPSSEPRNNADATFLDPYICCRLLGHAARHADSTSAARYDRQEVAGMANFKMYLLRQFCSNRVEFFYNTQEPPTQKMMDQNSNSVIFEKFLKFSERRRAVPLRPIWTIMDAAKLDQSIGSL